ncbi:Adaptor for signal transduction [Tulasnella sp. 424]|nr:Adaptor for signal transduction [Tulasnella sp. 424]KAG8975887.1 Adaptor for signal transduction [Tulasnella sp. 425]
MASNAATASGEEDSSSKNDGKAPSATEGGRQTDKPRQSTVGKKKESKKGRPSSYWSKLERKVYLEQLALHGKSWYFIAQEVKTKTPAQCLNFYNANEKGMELDKIVEAWEAQNRESESEPERARENSSQLTMATLTDLDPEQVPPEKKKVRKMWYYVHTGVWWSPLDEKPLLLFKKLKDVGKNSVFMLRQVRNIRAPISVARGKQAEKKGRDESTDQTKNCPLKKIGTSEDGDRSRTATEMTSTAGNGAGHIDAVILWTGVSYAIVIFLYGQIMTMNMTLQGAMFVVLRRSKAWWEVQRDPTGSGTVDERARRCWVPSGCLLETNMPPSTAFSEALTVTSTQPPSPSPPNLASPVGGKPMSDAPILPSSIISTSYPVVALMDWHPQGDHELDLVKDDLLRVFKRYNHWSYVAKESGHRGWVPGWLIGKVSSGSANPPTAGTGL